MMRSRETGVPSSNPKMRYSSSEHAKLVRFQAPQEAARHAHALAFREEGLVAPKRFLRLPEILDVQVGAVKAKYFFRFRPAEAGREPETSDTPRRVDAGEARAPLVRPIRGSLPNDAGSWLCPRGEGLRPTPSRLLGHEVSPAYSNQGLLKRSPAPSGPRIPGLRRNGVDHEAVSLAERGQARLVRSAARYATVRSPTRWPPARPRARATRYADE